MIKPKSLPRDTNERAHKVAQLLTGETELATEPEQSSVSIYLAQIGRIGGLKGGKARAKILSKSKRRTIAKKAAQARWNKSKNAK